MNKVVPFLLKARRFIASWDAEGMVIWGFAVGIWCMTWALAFGISYACWIAPGTVKIILIPMAATGWSMFAMVSYFLGERLVDEWHDCN